MAVSDTKILFEGFLQKRKDTMRVRWATYWFRLQNTTLFFYTKKTTNALNLRGNYYIYTVQSVREVYRANSKRYMFEINMNNGKRKLLAAETAELRERWVGHLWQAMHLSTSCVSVSVSTSASTGAKQEVCEQQQQQQQQQREEAEGLESPPPRPLPAPKDHHEIRDSFPPTNTPEALVCKSAAVWEESHYDVLPIREGGHEVRTVVESVYDVPRCHRMAEAAPVAMENIYDVPRTLLRKSPDHNSAEDLGPEEKHHNEIYWRI